MKKILLALTMMASTYGVFAQETVPAAVVTNPNAPTMKFDKDAIDYGTIKQDADGNRVFTFTNDGKEPIIISEAHGSCGCTVPTYPKEPIMPGKTAEIKVRYDTHRVGPFSKSVTVNSNAKNSPVVLRISGTVEAAAAAPAATTEPTSIIPTPVAAPTTEVVTATKAAAAKAVTKTSATKATVKSKTATPVKKTTSTTKKTTTTVKKTTAK